MKTSDQIKDSASTGLRRTSNSVRGSSLDKHYKYGANVYRRFLSEGGIKTRLVHRASNLDAYGITSGDATIVSYDSFGYTRSVDVTLNKLSAMVLVSLLNHENKRNWQAKYDLAEAEYISELRKLGFCPKCEKPTKAEHVSAIRWNKRTSESEALDYIKNAWFDYRNDSRATVSKGFRKCLINHRTIKPLQIADVRPHYRVLYDTDNKVHYYTLVSAPVVSLENCHTLVKGEWHDLNGQPSKPQSYRILGEMEQNIKCDCR